MTIISPFFLFISVMSFVSRIKGFSSVKKSLNSLSLRSISSKNENFQLVLVRHGESTWNDLNKFTGWYDCPLSQKGSSEAIAAGKLLQENKFVFDLAYSSYLKRAIRTLWHVLEETDHMYIPIKNAWQLNERLY
jgi:2,3-bisphosphoglycerate-dependent phosphoglycerate mutase